jgi:hypothetical protein
VKKNTRIHQHDMDITVLQLDIIRKEKKMEWLTADIKYHQHRQNLFLQLSETMFNL